MRRYFLTAVVAVGLLLPTVAVGQAVPAVLEAERRAAAERDRSIMGRLMRVADFAGFQAIADPSPGGGLRQAARIVGMIIGGLLAFLGIVFLVLMIRAGIRWMLARGNESEIEGAKATIRSAIFGLLIVALSYAFVSLVGALVANTGLLQG